MKRADGVSLAVVIPLLDEEAVFPQLLERLRKSLDELEGVNARILFVNDGSTDGTARLIDAAARDDPRVEGVHLSRRFGHQAAISAGLDRVDSDWTVVMDGDLQDAPESIASLLESALEGFDVVYAKRVQRKENWALRLAYWAAYRLIRWFSAVELPIDAGDFGIMSRRVVEQIRSLPERQRFIRGLRAWTGFRQRELELPRAARGEGRTKYSLGRLVALALDGLFAFSVAPLRFMAVLGMVVTVVSTGYAAWLIYAFFGLDRSPPGFTTIAVAITFFAGVQLFFLGVIGEYVGRIYEEIKQRPLYVVDREVGQPRA